MANIKQQLVQLNKMSKKSVAIYHKFALSVGISDSSLGVLYALSEKEAPCSQYDLCGEWSIPKQTVNTAVSSLIKKGLVSVAPVPGTRNKKSVVLTDEGRTFVQKNINVLHEAELESFGELSEEEREMYIRLNQKYNEALNEKLNKILNSKN